MTALMRDFIMTVQGPPCLISSNHRTHWATRALLTRQWREATHWAAKAARLPRGLDRVHIVAYVHPAKGGRLRDAHNVYPTGKACVDGLVDYGLIADDDDAHLIGPDLRRGANRPVLTPALKLTITELEVAP